MSVQKALWIAPLVVAYSLQVLPLAFPLRHFHLHYLHLEGVNADVWVRLGCGWCEGQVCRPIRP